MAWFRFKMIEWALHHENAIRLSSFLGLFGLWAFGETLVPRRPRRETRRGRWPHNLALLVTGTALTRLLIPFGAMAAAISAQERGLGLLPGLALHDAFKIAIAIVALDLVIFLQHILFHKVPWLWRLHRVHHSDRDFDVTTALRFHPLEILLSVGIKIGAVLALGAHPLAVMGFEVLLNGAAMFNHANSRLPPALDAFLRIFIVTPDMHRVHHSVLRIETDSNFGFNLSLWDRLFRTYRAQPAGGQQGLIIGLPEHQDSSQSFFQLLRWPFQKESK